MHRDPLPQPIKRSLSAAASPHFFFLADAIAVANEPTPSQLEALERSYMATGQFVMDSPEFKGLVLQVHAQGSRAIGTLVRPRRERPEGFDVDIVIRLQRDALVRFGNSPVRLINELHKVIERYANAHGLALTRWERCVTLEYADGMCVDLTPIVEDERFSIPHGGTHARVPDRELQLFDPTNPMGLVRTFDDAARVRANFTRQLIVKSSAMDSAAELVQLPNADQVQSRLLSRLVQLLKLHRNVKFGSALNLDLSPRSVFVTSLAASAYVMRAPIAHESPLDLLLDIVATMPLLFRRCSLPSGGEHWDLPNPTAPGDNLASGMNAPGRQAAFLQWHASLVSDLERVIACIERRAGQDVLQTLVEQSFGKRAAQALQAATAPKAAPPNLPVTSLTSNIGTGRIVSVGTAIPSVTVAAPTRAHRFFGDQ
ncbi:hypothetical protein VAR608DRAFT_4083 [Variovorax sp. HW608]|uniref:nucleotidyltransferase domain-containing protein n=1 Tax=Variovorax sp. HW608 TaxID=1034889 RepID=UPI00081F811C|nr:nucleotidyltransferase [Variovorax sp. HW608]SCK42593.1 hypothetical protein VAR608DRAFT_4083 [Variovorax sp. HW608]